MAIWQGLCYHFHERMYKRSEQNEQNVLLAGVDDLLLHGAGAVQALNIDGIREAS